MICMVMSGNGVRTHGMITIIGAPLDGQAWESGSSSNRVIRGGGWNFGAGFCRSAHRGGHLPNDHYSILGFRLLKIP